MNQRVLAASVILALGLGAAGLWRSRSRSAPPEPRPAGPATQAQVSGPQGSNPPAIETPTAATAGKLQDAATRTEPAPAPELPLEPVEPLLELNFVAAGGIATADLESVAGSVDELLGGKHAGKNKSQLEVSLRSVQAVLAFQKDPDQLPKDRILSAEAISALEIEAGWLKEQIFNN